MTDTSIKIFALSYAIIAAPLIKPSKVFKFTPNLIPPEIVSPRSDSLGEERIGLKEEICPEKMKMKMRKEKGKKKVTNVFNEQGNDTSRASVRDTLL